MDRIGLKKKKSGSRKRVDLCLNQMSGSPQNPPDSDRGTILESGAKGIEDSFITAISECVSEAIKINYKDRTVFQSCLQTATARQIRVLLEQYLHHELEIIGERFQREFEISEKINFDYATHAKMRDIIDAIKQKMKETI